MTNRMGPRTYPATSNSGYIALNEIFTNFVNAGFTETRPAKSSPTSH